MYIKHWNHFIQIKLKWLQNKSIDFMVCVCVCISGKVGFCSKYIWVFGKACVWCWECFEYFGWMGAWCLVSYFGYLKYLINVKSCAVGRDVGSLHVRRETASCNGTGTRGSILCTDSSNCTGKTFGWKEHQFYGFLWIFQPSN